jgi:hypothetical protein
MIHPDIILRLADERQRRFRAEAEQRRRVRDATRPTRP